MRKRINACCIVVIVVSTCPNWDGVDISTTIQNTGVVVVVVLDDDTIVSGNMASVVDEAHTDEEEEDKVDGKHGQ